MWILTADEMQAADRQTIQGLGLPGACLMELAGAAAARALWDAARLEPGAPVVLLCGAGNNGGDGYVIARHLANRGACPEVLLLAPSERIGGDALTNLQVLQRMGLPVHPAHTQELLTEQLPLLARSRVRVDAILGTGLRQPVRGMAAAGIEALNAAPRGFVLAVDLPSGLDADRGQPLGDAVWADLTVTFGCLKRGQVLHPGPSYCGEVVLADIGIPPDVVAALEPGLRGFDREDLRERVPPRPRDCHKGDFGRVLVLAGSPEMAGAGLLAARGAARCGAGVVTLATVEEGCAACRARYPSLITQTRVPGAAVPAREAARGFDAAVIGPGLGLRPESEALVAEWVAHCPLPLVVDADALTLLGRLGPAELLAAAPAPRILTPHEGELARLVGCERAAIHADRVGWCHDVAQRWGAVVLLKGNGTLVSDGRAPCRILRRGGPELATGGSGDVLAGAVAALLGQGLDALTAACAAGTLHALAGEAAAARLGPRGLSAEDLAELLPAAWAEVER